MLDRERNMSQLESNIPSDGGETLVEAALRVLNTADPVEKAKLGDAIACKWLQGVISQPYHPSIDLHIPDRPARLTNVIILYITCFCLIQCQREILIICVFFLYAG